jgi:hypothetical protein
MKQNICSNTAKTSRYELNLITLIFFLKKHIWIMNYKSNRLKKIAKSKNEEIDEFAALSVSFLKNFKIVFVNQKINLF